MAEGEAAAARLGPPAGRTGGRLVAAVVAGHAALLVVTWLVASRTAALPGPAAGWVGPLDGSSATRALAALRRELDGGEAQAVEVGAWRGRAALWCRGQRLAGFSVEADGGRVAAPGLRGVAAAAGLGAADRAACRLRLDVEVGRAPIAGWSPALLSVSLVPGLDGLGLDLDDRRLLLDVDELVAADLLAGNRPLPALDYEAGLDVPAALRHLALLAGVDGRSWRTHRRQLYRVRSQGWVEPPGATGPAVALWRGWPPAPTLSPGALRAAATRGAAYLERHLGPEGRFDYVYDAIANQRLPDATDYSLPRHAGAAYYLAQAAHTLGDPRLAAAAGRALDNLSRQAPPGCQGPALACVGPADHATVDLGSSALALLAALEYRRATSDARFDPWARRLGAFLVRMQRDDGDFRHLYHPAAAAADDHARLLYFSGEATLALSRLAADAGTDAASAADLRARVDRALDHITGAGYDYFAGGFFYGEEHWTCMAVDDAWEHLPDAGRRARYADFCEGFAAFIGRSRFSPGDGALVEQPDLIGGYGFTALPPVHPTPTGARTEALLSIWRVARARGHSAVADRLATAIRQSLSFLLSRQISAAGAWMMPDPGAALGGFPESDVRFQVRIDYVQHCSSALLRAAAYPELSGEAPAGMRN